MKQYLDLLKEIKENGIGKDDRTGTGVRGVFGMQAKYNLDDGFPLVTTKKTFMRIIIVELIWLLRGETNIKYLVDRNCHIWDEWPFQNYIDSNGLSEQFPKYSDAWMEEKSIFIEKIASLPSDDAFVVKWGDLGPVYGHQWRNFNSEGVDQIKNIIDQIKNNPTSRRIIVSAWNPAQLDKMLLPPCHAFFQFNVDTTNNRLNLQLYQRSADMFLGVPFNIASYSTLLIMIAKITGLTPGTFTHTLGDAHIYNNHVDQVNEQLLREPFPLPELKIHTDIQTLEDIENLEWADFEVVGYQSHGVIRAPVAV
ncbi:thymidylate synthase [Candidatus Gracilibacteria bacterium 28_42_T64]|nr:thymidylate synthase [Candidatus Gracilibacteria bacterium 28_42_T64]